jgi:tRNA(Arg) A34 adenosine deaminase TadA
MEYRFPELYFRFPVWTESMLFSWDHAEFATIQGRMRFAVALAQYNVTAGTGGPFGAAVFDCATNVLIAPGMNLVLSSQCSVLHAEIVAIMMAQKIAGAFDLSLGGRRRVELVSSVAPCAMCLGAIPWAGISRLVCGARDEDARAIGFDEGAKVPDWTGELNKRGIETATDIGRDEAMEVLKRYKSGGGAIYNSKSVK